MVLIFGQLYSHHLYSSDPTKRHPSFVFRPALFYGLENSRIVIIFYDVDLNDSAILWWSRDYLALAVRVDFTPGTEKSASAGLKKLMPMVRRQIVN